MVSTQPEIRYLTNDELSRIRRYAKSRAVQALQKSNACAVRKSVLFNTLLPSGLRASEAAALGRSPRIWAGFGWLRRVPASAGIAA